MPALTLTINQVKEIHQKLSSGTIMKYPPGIVKASLSRSSVAGHRMSCGGYGHMGIIAGTRSSGGCWSWCFFLAGTRARALGRITFSRDPFRFTIPFPFLTNLYCDLDFSQDLTLQILFVFEPSQREKTEKSKASRAVQMQTRASMAFGTVEVGKRAGVIACKSFLSTAHIALWHANRSLPKFLLNRGGRKDRG